MHHMKSHISHKELARIAHLTGLSEQELIDRAVLLYLESFRGMAELEEEIIAWDVLSDEALERMESHA